MLVLSIVKVGSPMSTFVSLCKAAERTEDVRIDLQNLCVSGPRLPTSVLG